MKHDERLQFLKEVGRIILSTKGKAISRLPMLEMLELINFVKTGAFKDLCNDIEEHANDPKIKTQALKTLNEVGLSIERIMNAIYIYGSSYVKKEKKNPVGENYGTGLEEDGRKILVEAIKKEFTERVLPGFTAQKEKRRFNSNIRLTKDEDGNLNEFGALYQAIRDIEEKGEGMGNYHWFLKSLNRAIGKIVKLESDRER